MSESYNDFIKWLEEKDPDYAKKLQERIEFMDYIEKIEGKEGEWVDLK